MSFINFHNYKLPNFIVGELQFSKRSRHDQRFEEKHETGREELGHDVEVFEMRKPSHHSSYNGHQFVSGFFK